MDVNDGTDLAAMHQAITDGIAGAFPGVHVEFYREDRKNLPLGDGTDKPSAYVLLDLPEMDATADAPDPGTEQQALRARFEAEIIMRALKPGAKVDVRVLAGSLAAYLRQRSRWPGVLNGPIHVSGCYRDDFNPELDQFEVWRVEWTQEVRLGEGVWKETGDTPANVFLAFVPADGPREPAVELTA
jgi:hypothetical protein